jgi:hypothetical protein
MKKKKEKMMMMTMMTLCLSDLEEWGSSQARNTNQIRPETKEKNRNSIDALEAALCCYQISERKKCGELGYESSRKTHNRNRNRNKFEWLNRRRDLNRYRIKIIVAKINSDFPNRK